MLEDSLGYCVHKKRKRQGKNLTETKGQKPQNVPKGTQHAPAWLEPHADQAGCWLKKLLGWS